MASDEGAGLEASAGNQSEGFAAEGRGVMEGSAQRDVAIVNAVGVERDVRIPGAAAEEIHRAAFAHQFHRLLPRLRHAHGLDGDIHAAIVGRERARFLDGFTDGRVLHHVRRAQLPRGLRLAVVPHQRDGLVSRQCGHVQNHQSQRPAPDDGNKIAPARLGILESMHRAGQRLGKRRVFQRHILRHANRVHGHDALGNADELCVRAVVEEQIVAEILLAAQAEIAFAARRGIERHHAIARREIRDTLAGFENRSRQFVAEERRGHDHARVIAAPEDLEVRPASKRSAHVDDQLARRRLGDGNLLDADIFASMENGGLHGAAPKKRALHRPAAQADGGFDRPAALDDHCVDGIQACFDNRLDGIQAALDDVLDFFAALFDNAFDRFAAAEDRVFHGVRHRIPYSAPAPGTGSIIIFIESGCGLDAISMAATASSSGKRCEINCVRSKLLR